MTTKKRVEKLEQSTNTGEDIIDEIQIEIINPDGSSGGTIISKKLKDGRWTDYEEQN